MSHDTELCAAELQPSCVVCWALVPAKCTCDLSFFLSCHLALWLQPCSMFVCWVPCLSHARHGSFLPTNTTRQAYRHLLAALQALPRPRRRGRAQARWLQWARWPRCGAPTSHPYRVQTTPDASHISAHLHLPRLAILALWLALLPGSVTAYSVVAGLCSTRGRHCACV